MSYPLGNSGQPERMENYLESVDPHWAGAETSPFVGEVSHPYTTAHGSAAALTPISVADSSFLPPRPSPVLSHHSQEYQYPAIDDSVARHGLGITTPYQGQFVQATPFEFGYPPGAAEFGGYGSEHGLDSPQPPRSKRPRRPTRTTPPMRYSPVRILPHPAGLQRLEQERRQSQGNDSPQREPQRPRASGRGRRDPQAEEEDAYVESLRQQNLSWKVVAEMFRERFNKESTEARLQMRMLRRRKSAAAWHEADIPLLLEAHEYWQNEKYKIIAAKLQELGATRTYTEQQCESQLRILLAGGTEEETNIPPPPPPPPLPPPSQSPDSQRPAKRKRTLEVTEDQ
ncbi:hypothetical protein T310_0873 [Rasamsonia emersonii CBS 393.64]|uniref:Myb-like domain-containing protein n=1 Tax=Rasamsonia emersonii (strain ATCC 16479 / CBS 393.64 / IMI 116815) TaxID=1408163 RepID=A0A0F4Z3J2_RASE3|nr:hypothetical protein T310_0873 [Rasamsonia emersonii CBS 393.64]KKA25099.1 hypothetical protein T310_0873 [Rasamsonia emersonii CBS 393.64]